MRSQKITINPMFHHFLLGHITGSVPGDLEVDVPIVEADYNYVDTILRPLAY